MFELFKESYKEKSFCYKYYQKWYKKRCQKKLSKYLRADNCVTLYIGLPRSGKTTFIAYLTNLCNVCNYPVYCNIPVEGALPFSKDDIGKYDMSNSLILLDEAGIMYDNRQFKTAFSEESLSFLKLIGHYKSRIFLFSQSMDIDCKWLGMSKEINFVRRSLIPEFTSIIKVNRILDVNPDTHKIEDFYDKETGIIKRIFHFRFYRKPYYKMFDSYDAPKLKPFPNLPKYQKYKFNRG